MTQPGYSAVRDAVFARDGLACLACGSPHALEFQHRQATGMGGTSKPVSPAGGIVLCSLCNERTEADMQTDALRFGWKVRRWIDRPTRVPVYSLIDRTWWHLDDHGSRERLDDYEAEHLMRLAYGPEWDDMQAVAA